jgi:hypothetical protein
MLLTPRRLAFKWTWEPPDPHAGVETLVTIDLYEKEGGTKLALTHARFPTAQLMRQHESGWGEAESAKGAHRQGERRDRRFQLGLGTNTRKGATRWR